MRRRLRVLIVSVLALLTLTITGLTVTAWWLARPPAPAPAGMAQRFIDEHRALLEESWPEGEPAWPLLLEAEETLEATRAGWSPPWQGGTSDIGETLATDPPETARVREARRIQAALAPVVDLLLDATRSERFHAAYEDPLAVSTDPSWDDLWFMPDEGAPSLLALWTRAEFRRAAGAGDVARAAEAFGASLRLGSYRVQRPSSLSALSVGGHLQRDLRLALDTAREETLSIAMCEAIIDAIESEGVAQTAIEAPIVDGERLFDQMYAFHFRESLRTADFVKRLFLGIMHVRTSKSAVAADNDTLDGWFTWLQAHSPESVERIIDEHYDAVEEWWAKPFGQRAPSPGIPTQTAGAPVFDILIGDWTKIRGMLDLVRSREAGTVLLLRIEAHMAKHGGPPERLEDAAEVEETIDPLTGRPFLYKRREGAAAGEWPYSLRTPLTLEEFATLRGQAPDDPETEQRWIDWTTLTLPPLDTPTPEEVEATLWMLPESPPE